MVPGINEARRVEAAINKAGVWDVKLLFDQQINMWAVVQVRKPAKGMIILPKTYQETDVQPYLMWWIKDTEGKFRLPDDRDIKDILVIVHKGRKEWETDPTGEKMARRLDEQSAEKDRQHQQKFRDKIHTIAPAMQKAVRKELGHK